MLVIGTGSGAALALTRPATPPAPVVLPAPPAGGPWTGTVQNVENPGVALRTTPTRKPGTPIVGRLPVGATLQVQCAQTGDPVATAPGQYHPTWLRTPEGLFVTAIYVQLDGPNPVPNCDPGQPALALPTGTTTGPDR